MFIEGRLSRFSKIGGEMIPHGTIEQKIVEAYDIDQVEGYAICVMGVADVAKGEALVLLTTMDIDPHELRDRLVAVGLPNLWVPRLIHKVETIPVLGSGKLDLKGCKELAIELYER